MRPSTPVRKKRSPDSGEFRFGAGAVLEEEDDAVERDGAVGRGGCVEECLDRRGRLLVGDGVLSTVGGAEEERSSHE